MYCLIMRCSFYTPNLLRALVTISWAVSWTVSLLLKPTQLIPVSMAITNRAALMAKLATATCPIRLVSLKLIKPMLTAVRQTARQTPLSNRIVVIIAGTSASWTPMAETRVIAQPVSPAIVAHPVHNNRNTPAQADSIRAMRTPMELLVLMGLSTFKPCTRSLIFRPALVISSPRRNELSSTIEARSTGSPRISSFSPTVRAGGATIHMII